MLVVLHFVVLFLIQYCSATFHTGHDDDLRKNLKDVNTELMKLNSVTSYLSWKLLTGPVDEFTSKFAKLGKIQIEWRKHWCSSLLDKFTRILEEEEQNEFASRDYGFSSFAKNYGEEWRQFYLLCRGPTYSFEESRKLFNVLGKLESIYEDSQVCLDDGNCFRGEPDLERLMAKSRDPKILLWAWTEWRNKVGPPSKIIYPTMVSLLNRGARNNGYREIGECWREELEVDNLEDIVEKLYEEIKPLYVALHAVVRYKLRSFYGEDLISLHEPIPAHLLGNMWAQNWASLIDVVTDFKQEYSFTHYLRKKNYTVVDMVKKAEDFFVSLGFRPMTSAFWKYSKLGSQSEKGSTCHGTAANMFYHHDFRIVICAEITEEDFSVIHHEMGHIAYYMEYENQPAIFQEGVNSAFQESIGDAIMYGVTSLPHMERLEIIKDADRTPELEIKLLLKQALAKIPQIPFALMLEKWRWNVFKGNILPSEYNEKWWALREKYQGVKPPIPRSKAHFDPSSKFHINDNKPYIRYFLSSILQMQIYDSLCKAAIFGENYKNRSLPKPMPMHKCDIYGSTTATKNLRKMMSKGSAISWEEALNMVVGESSYSVRPLMNYYQPLYKWLLQQIEQYQIPVGWNGSSTIGLGAGKRKR